LPSGLIMKGIGGFYYVLSGESVYECKARGIFRRKEITPLPGDRVEFSVGDETKKIGNIDEIHERDSLLVRPAVANVNQVAVVIAVKLPDPDFMLLDKLLVTAEKDKMNAVLCINKVDLSMPGEHAAIGKIYENAGYKVVYCNSTLGEGFDELRHELAGRITVFAGQSGVGKSTILNRLMDSLLMETGGLSKKIGRGKHTTRHAELIPLVDGGFLVDTPGFSSFELAGISPEELKDYYPEFGGMDGSCRFKGCSHSAEPDCKVKEGIDSGLINPGRHARYVELLKSLKQADDMKYR